MKILAGGALVAVLALTACSSGGDDETTTQAPTATVTVTEAPDTTTAVDEACAAWEALPDTPTASDVDAYADIIVALPTEQRRVFLTYAGLNYQTLAIRGEDLLDARSARRDVAAVIDGICA